MNTPAPNEIFLTIGIPTYLRQESLLALLAQIARTTPSQRCELLIINNGPPFEMEAELAPLRAVGYETTVIQNQRNCGGQENVIRVYENARGKYVWFLGDDDRLYADSVSSVVTRLVEHPCDCLLFDADAPDHPIVRLASGDHDEHTIFGGSIPLRKLMFAPLAVLRAECYESALARVRLHLGCFAPQLLLLVCGQFLRYHYYQKKIITCEDVDVGRDQRLSILPVFLGISGLPEASLSKRLARQLARRLHGEWWDFLRPTRVIAAFAIGKIQGATPPVGAFIRAGFRNYPLWLAVFWPVWVLAIRVSPVRLIAGALHLVGNRILKKNVDFSKYFSTERI